MLPVKSGLSVTEMVDRMTGLDALDGWGVLVAYDETALNKLLAARHATLPSHVTTIPALDAVVPGTTKTIKYRAIQLGPPFMKLNAHTNLIHLFFSISGFYTSPDSVETPFDADLFLDVTAKLVTTTGHTNNPSLTPAGAVHVFEDSGASHCDAAIDLSSPLLELVDADHAPLYAMADVAGALTDHISSVGLSYRLATLARGPEPVHDVSGVLLRPREFVMTAVEAKDGRPGALLIWIAVEGGRARGTLPSEDEEETLVFARRVEDLCRVNPIPGGANACVVISQEVFGSLFVKPQMERLGYSDVKFVRNGLPPGEKDESKISKTGLSFEAKPPSRDVKLAEITQGDPKSMEGEGHVDAVTFNMNTSNCRFFIDRSSSYAYLEYAVSGVGYYRKALVSSINGVSEVRRADGKAKLTFRAKGDGAWRAAGNEGIAASFTLPANFTVGAEPEKNGFWEGLFLTTVTDSRIKAMDNLSTAVPDVTVDLGSIQLFLATNLLLPGEHIFKLKGIPDNLHIPHDVYLLGDI